jgi:hypothetical protein
MADRLPAFLPRVAAIALLVLCATAGLTYAAGSSLPSTPETPAATVAAPSPLVVPDVRGQAYVFAKGTLEESGFAWRVAGSVQGYAANVVTLQTPPAGTKLVDTGSPLITLTLKRNAGYPQVGEPENASPFAGSVVQPEATEGVGPALPAATARAATTPAATTPAATAPAATTPAATAEPKAKPAKWPQNRPAAFSVPGATKEPLDEMPLPTRAKALMTWLEAHPQKSHSNVDHWMYQHEWIVTGAKMGWWRGAEALQTLVSVDRRAQQLWGVGGKSEGVALQALAEVRAKASS